MPSGSSTCAPNASGVFRAQLEDVAGLDAADDLERSAAVGARFARDHLAQVGPLVDGDVAFDVDTGPMPVVFVGPRGQAGPALERGIDNDPEPVDVDGSE